MAATKLSSREKRDLDKYTKFLICKCIQMIVQARLGEKKRTKSKPYSSGQDWFNLAINDAEEISSEIKKVYTTSSLIYENPINVEISLKTSEGENMILEVWSLSINTELCDNSRVSFTVYNRMSTLLKSLMCVSRVTPAYKLSRNQGSETFVVCYRIYMGEPITAYLGSGATTRRVGVVPTPCGTIELAVSYRTKIMFSPHQSTLSIELKDDHFTEVNPNRGNSPRPCKPTQRRHSTATSTQADAENEACATVFSISPISPYRSPGNQRKKSAGHINGDLSSQNGHHEHSDKPLGPSTPLKFGAFTAGTITEQPKIDDDIPFSTLLHQHTDTNANKQVMQNGRGHQGEDVVDNEEAANTARQMRWRRRRHASADSGSSNSQPDDFVMVELKTPFAGSDGASELGRFYRECQGAPALHQHTCHALDEDPAAAADSKHFINGITDQLSQFEAQSHEFDNFIDGLLIGDE